MLSKMFNFIAQVKDSPGLVSTDSSTVVLQTPKTMIDSAKRQS